MKLEHDHTPEAIHHRLARGPRATYLRDWIYGGIDGAVTTFAVVSGVAGANLASSVIVILGVANLVADGFSMAASNYSGTRAEQEDEERLRAIELRHIEQEPDGEREEVRQIYASKGLAGESLNLVVEAITADRTRWVETMLSEEYGLSTQPRSPFWAGFSTFSAFQVCGAVPLLPYLLGMPEPFTASAVMTGATFFAIGCARSRWSLLSWWRAGLGTLSIGGAAAALAYLVGHILRGLGTPG
jgi:vacuolar iron transporter family protein